jgi:hypothetical protein
LAVFQNPPAEPAALQFGENEHQRYPRALSAAYLLFSSQAAQFVGQGYKWDSVSDMLDVIREGKRSEDFPITQRQWQPTPAVPLFDRSGMTEPQRVWNDWWEQVFDGVIAGQSGRNVTIAPVPGEMWLAPSWEGCAMVLWSCPNHAMLNGCRLSDYATPVHQVLEASPNPSCHSTFAFES